MNFQPGQPAIWRWYRADEEWIQAVRPELCHSYRVTIIGPSSVTPGLIDCRCEADGHIIQAVPRELTPIEGGAA